MKKIPYGITFHPSWWNKNAGIDFSQPFFDDWKYRIDCDIKMRKTLYEHFGKYGIGEKDPAERPLLGTDLLAAGYLYSELMGCEIIYEPNNSPQVICAQMDIDAVADVKVPNLDNNPIWKRTQNQIDELKAKYGRVETYINLQGIQNIALDLMGQELFMSYYSDPDETKELLEKITVMSVDIGKRFYSLSSDVSGGVTGIVRTVMPNCYLTSNCSVDMVSNDCYEEFLLPYDTVLANEFTCFGIHHCGKTMEHVCAGYAKVPNLKFAEVGAGSDMAFVRNTFPDVYLNARYSAVNLPNDSENEIMTNVETLMDQAKAQNGLTSISCVGIDGNTDDGKILAFLDACEEVNRKYSK